jgi:Ca-activated chloride channel family protein
VIPLFAAPALLLLLPLLAALAALRWWWGRRVLRQRAAVGAGSAHLTGSVARARGWQRQALLWSGVALATAALAEPRWGMRSEVRAARGADVLVLLDCSRSMLATDLYPTRLEAARRKCLALFHAAPETRMALVPFAAIATLRCPLTSDHNALAAMLQDCDPALFPADQGLQGTAIGDAVRFGLKLLRKQVDRGQAILVLSDGADDDHDAVQAACELVHDAGVPVYGLFLGDPARKATLVIDGKEEQMDASRETLDALAVASGGICVNAGNGDEDIAAIHRHLRAQVAQNPWEERHRVVAGERYQWLVLPGFALILLGALVPLRRRREAPR